MTVYNVSIAEAATAADHVSAKAVFKSAIAEAPNIAATDAYSATGSFHLTIAEAASAVDSEDGTKFSGSILSETAHAVDTISASLVSSDSIDEVADAEDAIAVVGQFLYYDRVKYFTPSMGVGVDLIVGAPVVRFQTPDAAGARAGDVCSILIEQGDDWELDTATYSTAFGAAFASRTFRSSSTGSPLVTDGSATVCIVEESPELNLVYTGVTPGIYGDNAHVAQFIVDNRGKLFFAANIPITGVAGAAGAAGSPGADGDWFDGDIGPPGQPGQPGQQGAQGLTGIPGADGDWFDGDIGPPGTPGATGATGATGAASTIPGPPGLEGDWFDGDMGPPGTAGAAGTNGTNADISPFSNGGLTKPAAADFTIADDASAGHGTGSKADLSSRGVEFTITCGTNGSTQSLFYVAALSSTLGAVTAYVAPNFQRDNLNFGIGVGVRDNAGKIHAFGWRNSSPTAYVDMRYTTISLVATLTTLNGGQTVASRPLWLKLAKVSTNFVYSVSFNGETFFTVSTVSATVFVGATLNDVGFFSFFNGASGDTINFDCFSFVRT